MQKLAFGILAFGLSLADAYSQSTVKMGGTVDVAIRSTRNGSAGSIRQVGVDGVNNSQLYFEGREDLGDGLWAGFNLRSGFNPDNGTTNNQFFNRRSTLSLGGKFGELRAGRDFNPSFWNIGLNDPFSNGVGNFQNIVSTLGSGARTLLRTDNSVGYFLPSTLGGVFGQAMVAAGEGVTGNKYFGARLGYAAGANTVAIGFGKTQGLLGEYYQLVNAGGQYDFGFLKVMGVVNRASYLDRKQVSYLLGVIVPIGVTEYKLAYGRAKMTGSATALATPFGDGDNANQLVVGVVYRLSKRSALYTNASQITNSGNSRRVVDTLPSVAGMLGGEKSRGIEFGMTHFF